MKGSLTEKEGFAIFRFPNKKEIHFISGNWKPIEIHSIGDSNGFIISDFPKSNCFQLEGVSSLYENQSIHTSNILKQFSEDKKNYLEKANLFIKTCKTNNAIEKLVLSRVFSKQLTISINELFNQLNHHYKNTFNCIFNHPDFGTWIVATPEILLKGKDNEYTTVALAGTMDSDNEEEWKEKESQEQQFVTDYLLHQIESIGEIHSEKVTFETIKAGKVKHRKTTVPFRSKKPPGEIADILHPTPAVGGTPKDEAVKFILENEGYNRKLYTGFIGYRSSDQLDLFVNLRCAEISDNQINVYVGGGLTKDSVAEKEWDETLLKSKTLLQFL